MNYYQFSLLWQFAVSGLIVIAAVMAYGITKGLRVWLFSSTRTSSIVATLFSVVVGVGTLTLLVVLFSFVLDHAFASVLLQTATWPVRF